MFPTPGSRRRQGAGNLNVAGTTQMSGPLYFSPDATCDIGTTGVGARPRDITAGQDLRAGRNLAIGGDSYLKLVYFNPDNTYDVGGGGQRPRDLLIGRTFYCNGEQITGHLGFMPDNTKTLGVTPDGSAYARPATTHLMTLNVYNPLVLASGQIQYPSTAVPSANANTLDDYREGTWVPTLTASVNSGAPAYAMQYGEYIKVGRLVLIAFAVTLSAKGSISGSIYLNNLPFPVTGISGPHYGIFHPIRFDGLATSWTMVTLRAPTTNASYLNFGGGKTLPSTTNMAVDLTDADLTASTDFMGTILYAAAS